jgi:hypothetical protein
VEEHGALGRVGEGHRQLHPYAGELKDQDGKQRVAAGGVLSDTDIRSMNWFVAGVIGKLS